MRTAIASVLVALTASAAAAQEPTIVVSTEIKRLSDPASTRSERARIDGIVGNFWKVVYIEDQEAINGSQKDINEILTFRRADVQVGAGAGASGTTSSVVSPLLPAIFGVALEDGAIIRTISGTTITFKISPAGLICAANPEAAAAVARRDDDSCRTFWRRVGATASFDTARGEKKTELANLQTVQNEFAAAAVRVEIVNRRKATGPQYLSAFKQAFATWKADATELANVDLTTEKDDELNTELEALVASPTWKTKKPEDREKEITALVAKAAQGVTVSDATRAEVRKLWLQALRSDRALQNEVLNAPVLTAEYAFQRPDVTTEAIGTAVPAGTRPPSLHTGRAIYAQGVTRLSLDVTSNASFSFFDEERAGMSGVFRDFRLGIEGKFKLRELANYGAPTLSLAGLFVHLHQPPLGLGIVAFNDARINQPGNIGVFQAKFELPTAKNTIRLPFSFTYSNRTELIKESDVRGQVGVSFNLDALFVEKK